MLYALFLLLFVLVAAPLAAYIPLASLAGVLAVVAWNMAEKHAFKTLILASPGDAAVLLATFGLTIFRDLTEAIIVGFALGSVLFIHRMSQTTAVETHTPFVAEDKADTADGGRAPYEERTGSDPDIVVYRISGAFFFGATASVGSVLERIGDAHRALVVDFSAVPFIDSTAAYTLSSLVAKAARRGLRGLLVRHVGRRPPAASCARAEAAARALRGKHRHGRRRGAAHARRTGGAGCLTPMSGAGRPAGSAGWRGSARSP